MICSVCQTPISGTPRRTVGGEPAHSDCLEDDGDDITPGDVEGAREELLDDDRLDDASEEYAAGWIDAAIAFDRLLTDPEHGAEDDAAYGVTD
ncbi:hypothetical protein [Natronoarchaeum rubrum]|uniref:hypothetical protein n=1 Tax=Natronoarchaeum rubrum TaxID=755311 RepID=UPI002112413F|nr:hypothetical protein [Natronoarchaeum rubrum]